MLMLSGELPGGERRVSRSATCRSALLLLLPLLVLTSCFSYQEVAFKGISTVSDARIDDRGIAVSAVVRIDNPNNFRIHVVDPSIDLYVNDAYIGKATLDSNVVLDKRAEKEYRIPLHATLEADQGQALMALMMATMSGTARLKAKGYVVGRVFIFRKRFPFEEETEFQLDL